MIFQQKSQSPRRGVLQEEDGSGPAFAGKPTPLLDVSTKESLGETTNSLSGVGMDDGHQVG